MTRPAAIVTGGRRGIGLAVAEALARAGFDLSIVDLAQEAAAADCRRALEGLGAAVAYVEADVSDLSRHRAIVEATRAAFGRVDCLVNNAGIGSPKRGDLLDLAPADFDRVLAVNLRGAVFLTQAVARAMLSGGDRGGPRTIVNVTSVSAAFASPERLDYCVSKAGLAMWSKGLALRLAADGIAVFDVRPGIVRTDMTEKVAERYDGLIAGGLVPARRWGEAGDVASVVAGLASGAFGFATGSVIDVGGGLAIPKL
jgi:NAD(P)-dependent dehydrogenase (short-subunit alcohol dehydrogenase family)